MKRFIFYHDACSFCTREALCRPVVFCTASGRDEQRRSEMYRRSVCARCLPVRPGEYQAVREIVLRKVSLFRVHSGRERLLG